MTLMCVWLSQGVEVRVEIRPPPCDRFEAHMAGSHARHQGGHDGPRADRVRAATAGTERARVCSMW